MNEEFQHTELPSSSLISVIVCSRDREVKLPRFLQALQSMDVADIRWELICVDNGSVDQTKRIFHEFISSSRIKARYVFEAIPRLSAARNAGLSNAFGDIIAFIDDDCLPDPNWLTSIFKEFDADPSLALLGGRVELHNPEDLPISIRTWKQRIIIQPTNFFSCIGAGNLAFRRSVVDNIGGFDPEFGPGAAFLAAEDSDFVYRALRAGFTAVYSPDPLVFHDHGRRTGGDRHKTENAYVGSRGAFYLKHIFKGDRQALRLAYWESAKLARQVLLKLDSNESRAEAARLLWYLLKGALRLVGVRARRVISGSRSIGGFNPPR